jgi:hypothetical protein
MPKATDIRSMAFCSACWFLLEVLSGKIEPAIPRYAPFTIRPQFCPLTSFDPPSFLPGTDTVKQGYLTLIEMRFMAQCGGERQKNFRYSPSRTAASHREEDHASVRECAIGVGNIFVVLFGRGFLCKLLYAGHDAAGWSVAGFVRKSCMMFQTRRTSRVRATP